MLCEKVLIKIFSSLQQNSLDGIRQKGARFVVFCLFGVALRNSWRSSRKNLNLGIFHFSLTARVFPYQKSLLIYSDKFLVLISSAPLTLMTSLESLGSFRRRKVGCSEETLKIFSSPSKTWREKSYIERNCTNEIVSHKCFIHTKTGKRREKKIFSSSFFHLFFPVFAAGAFSTYPWEKLITSTKNDCLMPPSLPGIHVNCIVYAVVL